jgi:putative heme iron utilization protein
MNPHDASEKTPESPEDIAREILNGCSETAYSAVKVFARERLVEHLAAAIRAATERQEKRIAALRAALEFLIERISIYRELDVPRALKNKAGEMRYGFDDAMLAASAALKEDEK